ETIQQSVTRGGCNAENERIAHVNLRARLRMSTWSTLAANHKQQVVGTDHQAESITVDFTKYRDGGVDLQPLIEFTKREVKELAKFLAVPEEVIEKKPSADLWVGQTDEQELGTTYEMIDNYLDGIAIPEKDREIIERLHRRTEHKRNLPPRFTFK